MSGYWLCHFPPYPSEAQQAWDAEKHEREAPEYHELRSNFNAWEVCRDFDAAWELANIQGVLLLPFELLSERIDMATQISIVGGREENWTWHGQQ